MSLILFVSSVYNVQKAYDLYDNRFYMKAIFYSKKALKKEENKNVYDYYYIIGMSYYKLKKEYLAKFYLEKALRLKPDLPDVCYIVAEIYKAEKNYEKAIKYYMDSIKYDPDMLESYYNIGYLLESLGQFSLARDFFSAISYRNPKEPLFKFKKGVFLFKKGNLEEALRNFIDVVKVKPSFLQAYFYIARIYLLQGKYRSSLRYLKRVVGLEPKNAKAWFLLGEIYYSIGKIREAIYALKRVISIDKNYKEAYFFLSEMYRLSNKPIEAYRYYNVYRSLR